MGRSLPGVAKQARFGHAQHLLHASTPAASTRLVVAVTTGTAYGLNSTLSNKCVHQPTSPAIAAPFSRAKPIHQLSIHRVPLGRTRRWSLSF